MRDTIIVRGLESGGNLGSWVFFGVLILAALAARVVFGVKAKK